jgi:hypothetical protein
MNTEEIETLIEDVFRRESKLNEWERRFMQSIAEQESLTPNQISKLEDIWDRIT